MLRLCSKEANFGCSSESSKNYELKSNRQEMLLKLLPTDYSSWTGSPKPPPVILLPYTPSALMAIDTSESNSEMLTFPPKAARKGQGVIVRLVHMVVLTSSKQHRWVSPPQPHHVFGLQGRGRQAPPRGKKADGGMARCSSA